MAVVPNMDLPFPQLTGGFHVDAYQDPDGDANTVLDINQPWSLKPHWWISGPGYQNISGTWHLKVIVESMGLGVEKTLLEQDFPLPASGELKPTINIPANSIPQEGVYKLVVVITYTNAFGKPGRMAGFVEGPILQFYAFN